MFSNLASYLLGYMESIPAVEAQNQLPVDNVALRLNAVETDDDWLLINTSGDEVQDENTPVDDTFYCEHITATPRSESLSSLPCLSMEESWFVTPPPCFTSSGPVIIETSPLENLLIEHPSMSVYHHRSTAVMSRLPRAHSASPCPSASAQSQHSEQPKQEALLQPLRPNNRSQNIAASFQCHRQLQCLDVKAAQKYQKRQSSQANRSQLQRNNKAREVSSRSRRQRRSDRQQQRSGANNNRKSC